MKNIFTRITAIATASAAISVALTANAPKAEAADYDLFWEGNKGYSATGFFSFSDDLLGDLITEDDLTDFSLSIFNPAGTLLQAFGFDSIKTEFNLNFDSATGTILQTGGFDTPTGFDFGIDLGEGETGIDFYTARGSGGFPEGEILLENIFGPNGLEPGSFEELDRGGTLIAKSKSVPEPTSISVLLAFGALGATSTLKKKLASAK